MKKLQAIIILFALCSVLYAQDPARQAKIEKALKELKDENSGTRGKAVLALGQLGAKEYANDIAELLKDEDDSVRAGAQKVGRRC